MYRVSFNKIGYSFDEYFDNLQDAKNFAKDHEAVGFQTLILKVK